MFSDTVRNCWLEYRNLPGAYQPLGRQRGVLTLRCGPRSTPVNRSNDKALALKLTGREVRIVFTH